MLTRFTYSGLLVASDNITISVLVASLAAVGLCWRMRLTMEWSMICPINWARTSHRPYYGRASQADLS